MRLEHLSETHLSIRFLDLYFIFLLRTNAGGFFPFFLVVFFMGWDCQELVPCVLH